MELEFLDIGLPVEPGQGQNAAKCMREFREYCNSLGKKMSELTEKELKAFNDRY